MTATPENAADRERRIQEHAYRTFVALEEVNAEYGDMRAMPAFPKDVPCRAEGVDPRLWDASSVDDLPESRARESFLRVMAHALCADCPVMDACGAWALFNDEPENIWGGMTPGERLEIRLRDDLAC